MRMVLTALMFLFLGQPVLADADVLPPVAELFAAPCLELGIPCPLTMAIARVESNLHPWSLNIEGRSFKFKTREAALAKACQAFSAGRSFDVGLMQVNSWWVRRYEIPLEAALDPLANIYLGGWILKSEIARHKDLRSAVGAYHSPNPDKARRYADVVMAALERGPVKSSAKAKAAARPKSSGTPARKPAAPGKTSENSPMKVKPGRSSADAYNFEPSMKVRSRSK